MSTQALISQALNNFIFDDQEMYNTLKQNATTEFSQMLYRATEATDEYIVHAPPQMGKTGYMLNACKMVKDLGILIVISVDNKKDQLDQTWARFAECGMPVYKASKMNLIAINSSLKNKKSVIVFCLNNACQVTKIDKLPVGRVTIIHDEGDLVHQSDSEDESGKTQKAWTKFCEARTVTRVWVSATPENCSYIRGIPSKNILRLPCNPEYVPVTHFTEWDTKDYNVLEETVNSLNPGDREVTLFCTDNTVKSHISIADNISLILPDCVVIVYNGTESYLIRDNVKEPFECGIYEILTCLEDKDYKIVIVGHALLSRGISFCSAGNTGPSYMATRMFYLGDNAHAVALSQRFGRIAGTCRPDLTKRTVYCSRDVYANYRGYLDNQVKVLDSESELDMVSALAKIENKRILSCKLDRATMRKMNTDYVLFSKNPDTESSSEEEDNGDAEYIPEKAKRLVSSWKKLSNKSSVAQLYRDMVSAGGKMENNKVETYFSKPSVTKQLTNDHRKWNLIFSRDSRYHYISNL